MLDAAALVHDPVAHVLFVDVERVPPGAGTVRLRMLFVGTGTATPNEPGLVAGMTAGRSGSDSRTPWTGTQIGSSERPSRSKMTLESLVRFSI